MSTTTATETHTEHTEHHELGFIRTYIFSTDHKMIARQFLFTALLFLALGGALAVFGAYDDSPGGTLMGFALVLGAMAFSARSARRSQ